MKKSMQIAVAAGVFAGMVFGAAPLRADEEVDPQQDMKVRLEALEEAIDGLSHKAEATGSVAFEGFVDIRFDDERNPNRSYESEQLKPTLDATRTDNNGQSGFYARRGEAKFSGKMAPTAVWSLGYDFVENKIKDLGIEFRDLPLIPFIDLPEYTWVARVGQYRMPFGIMPQTSSSAILFPERAFLNGGRVNNNTQFAAALAPTTVLLERVMGVQTRNKMKYAGLLAYDLQLGGFNNMTQDMAAGANRLQTQYTAQKPDQDLSWAGRLCLDHEYLYGFLPEKSRIATGASYFRDSKNSNYQTQLAAGQIFDEAIGAEFVLALNNNLINWTSEWVHMNKNITGFSGPTAGVGASSEGWYSDLALDWLPFFTTPEKGDALQTIFRLENQSNFDAKGAFSVLSRIAGGLKWSYLGGKNHTSLTYYVMAPDMQFGGDMRAPVDRGTGITVPETQLILQQQFAWETGKF